jgi:hypothetical protein
MQRPSAATAAATAPSERRRGRNQKLSRRYKHAWLISPLRRVMARPPGAVECGLGIELGRSTPAGAAPGPVCYAGPVFSDLIWSPDAAPTIVLALAASCRACRGSAWACGTITPSPGGLKASQEFRGLVPRALGGDKGRRTGTRMGARSPASRSKPNAAVAAAQLAKVPVMERLFGSSAFDPVIRLPGVTGDRRTNCCSEDTSPASLPTVS